MSKIKILDKGTRDETGHWIPSKPISYSPLFQLPWKPFEIIKWLFRWGGYLWPKRLAYVILATITWQFLQPDISVTKELGAEWIGLMLIRNMLFMIVVFGFYHLTLYVLKIQGDKGKYHPKWQAKGVKKFLFNNQVKDNIFFSLVSGIPIWTAYEILYVWTAANGIIPQISFSSNPAWFISFFLLIPLWKETHFYFIHRLIHWKPLLRSIHSLHHKNPNPGPWSGMSMHPIEHLLYMSPVLIHLVVPSHPIHFFFTAQLLALTPAQSHTGFEGPLFNGKWPAGSYFHYLHHKYVSCNFGGGLIPWDKWLGNFYDGEGVDKSRK
jgi:sterol desaturase/sphingolipid hydroxylase (fatty acid hydroxylase superfamily)